MTSNNAVDMSFVQNVIVMRHGDRLDNFDSTWIKTAERPYDPPLVDEGRARAYRTGLELRNSLGFPISRVFVSPFFRCVQTAAEAVTALGLDPSSIKVSIEYGLCEMLNEAAIRPESQPKDGKFHFNISELEAMLPARTVDTSAEKIYPEMLSWGETESAAWDRYMNVIRALADKYPSENLLLVTHAAGVCTSVSRFSTNIKDSDVYTVEYCGYSHVRRSINFDENGSYTSGTFKLLTVPHITGINFTAPSNLNDAV